MVVDDTRPLTYTRESHHIKIPVRIQNVVGGGCGVHAISSALNWRG